MGRDRRAGGGVDANIVGQEEAYFGAGSCRTQRRGHAALG